EKYVAEGTRLNNEDEIEAHKEKLAGVREGVASKFPNVQGQLGGYFDHLDAMSTIQLDNHKNKVMLGRIASETVDAVEDYNKRIAYETDPDVKESLRTERDAFIDIGADYG